MKLRPDKRIRLRAVVLFLLIAAAIVAVSTLLDRPVWALTARVHLPGESWKNALRALGYLPAWMAAAIALLLVDSEARSKSGFRAMAWRACFLAGNVFVSATLGEGAKLLIRRLRPILTAGEYVYRPWSQGTFDTGNLAMPSSHATVAFAGAWALCLLFPRAAPVWLAAAAGCAITRVLREAHFLSDVVAAALMSYAVARVLWQWRLEPRVRDKS